MNKAEALRRLKGLDAEHQKSVLCALVGHSRIVTLCFGYVHCARCQAQTGDTLGGTTELTEDVIVGHDCETCRKNFAKLTWRDKYLAPDPFKTEHEK